MVAKPGKEKTSSGLRKLEYGLLEGGKFPAVRTLLYLVRNPGDKGREKRRLLTGGWVREGGGGRETAQVGERMLTFGGKDKI